MLPSATRTFKATYPTLAPDPVHIDSDTCIGSNVWQSDLMERVAGHYLQLVTSLVETVRRMDFALQIRSHRNTSVKTNRTGGTAGVTVSSSSPSTVSTAIVTHRKSAAWIHKLQLHHHYHHCHVCCVYDCDSGQNVFIQTIKRQIEVLDLMLVV